MLESEILSFTVPLPRCEQRAHQGPKPRIAFRQQNALILRLQNQGVEKKYFALNERR